RRNHRASSSSATRRQGPRRPRSAPRPEQGRSNACMVPCRRPAGGILGGCVVVVIRAMKPTYFATPAPFRAWVQQHHADRSELLVGFRKKGSGRPSITWPESVDEALCFGWIDGVRKRVDDESYTIRFSPRRPESRWSAINIRRVEELKKQRKMR